MADLFEELRKLVEAGREDPAQLDFMHDYLTSLSPEDREQVLSLSLAEWETVLSNNAAPRPRSA